MGQADASKARSVLYDFLVIDVPHPLRLLSMSLESEERRERWPLLATGVSSRIENIIMDEASISTLCSLLLKVGERDLEGGKDMVQ
jgi:hypothetical protein